MEGENRNGCILGSIVTCYVGVSLHSMTYIYIIIYIYMVYEVQ